MCCSDQSYKWDQESSILSNILVSIYWKNKVFLNGLMIENRYLLIYINQSLFIDFWII